MTSRPSPDTPCGNPTERRIQYRCKGCPLTFTDAASSNAHHDKTGHNQTFRCPKCSKPLSGHTDEEYARCTEYVAPATEPKCGDIYVPTGAAACGWVQADRVRCVKERGHRGGHAAKFEEGGDTFSVAWSKENADTAPHSHECRSPSAYCELPDGGCVCSCGAIRKTGEDWSLPSPAPAPETDGHWHGREWHDKGSLIPCPAIRAVKELAAAMDADWTMGKSVDFPAVVERSLSGPAAAPPLVEPERTGKIAAGSLGGYRVEPEQGVRKVLDATEDSPAVYREGSRLVAGKKYDDAATGAKTKDAESR